MKIPLDLASTHVRVLTQISGKFMGGGESVRVHIGDGRWYLELDNQHPAGGHSCKRNRVGVQFYTAGGAGILYISYFDLGDALSLPLERKIMNISPKVKPALWGAAGGAVALAILGFTWGGWVTGSTATAMADKQATIEVAKFLAPVCFSQFNQQPDAAAKLAELKGIKSLYEQASYIEKSGAATMPGSDKMAKGVSQACAALLTKVAS